MTTYDSMKIMATWQDIYEAAEEPCPDCGGQLEKLGAGNVHNGKCHVDFECQKCELFLTALAEKKGKDMWNRNWVFHRKHSPGRLFVVRSPRG